MARELVRDVSGASRGKELIAQSALEGQVANAATIVFCLEGETEGICDLRSSRLPLSQEGTIVDERELPHGDWLIWAHVQLAVDNVEPGVNSAEVAGDQSAIAKGFVADASEVRVSNIQTQWRHLRRWSNVEERHP